MVEIGDRVLAIPTEMRKSAVVGLVPLSAGDKSADIGGVGVRLVTPEVGDRIVAVTDELGKRMVVKINPAGWTRMTATAEWAARDYSAMAALPDGSVVIAGGYSSVKLNDVWRSTDLGKTWTQMTASAGWAARYGHTMVALSDGSLVLAGGQDGTYTFNDVWRSTDNGANWTRQTEHAGWADRNVHRSVALADNTIIVTAGYDFTNAYHDVWKSVNLGVDWTQVTADAGFGHRYLTALVLDGEGGLVIVGGWVLGTGSMNDVWRSTNNGANWTRLVEHAGWSDRWGLVAECMTNGKILMTAGKETYGPQLHDVWLSSDYGATWVQQTDADWTARSYPCSARLTDGSIMIAGGNTASGKANDVWRYRY